VRGIFLPPRRHAPLCARPVEFLNAHRVRDVRPPPAATGAAIQYVRRAWSAQYGKPGSPPHGSRSPLRARHFAPPELSASQRPGSARHVPDARERCGWPIRGRDSGSPRCGHSELTDGPEPAGAEVQVMATTWTGRGPSGSRPACKMTWSCSCRNWSQHASSSRGSQPARYRSGRHRRRLHPDLVTFHRTRNAKADAWSGRIPGPRSATVEGSSNIHPTSFPPRLSMNERIRSLAIGTAPNASGSPASTRRTPQ
jgi:hypothetical protein